MIEDKNHKFHSPKILKCLLSLWPSKILIFSVTTEVWNLKTKTRTYNSFKDMEYWNPILFLVDLDFCI